MDIGIGLEQALHLSFAEQRDLIREAATLRYSSAWTPSGATTQDAFQICVHWFQTSTEIAIGGMTTGIAVVPAPIWSAPVLASVAGTAGELTEGRFILGVGTGGSYTESFQRGFGVRALPPVTMMREYVSTIRRLLAGERVDLEGKAVSIHGQRLAFRPPRVPVYLAALGPQMLRLAGEVADGVALNWCTPEQVAWSRERVAEGARRAGRDPAEVQIVQYIRVCVDDDEDVARRAFAERTLGYALARPGASKESGYRAHFGRMGFDQALTELEARRDRGASEEELADAFPPDLLRLVGYYGPADGAAAAFRELAEGLDVAIVRVVPARPGVEAVAAVLRACRPDLIPAGN